MSATRKNHRSSGPLGWLRRSVITGAVAMAVGAIAAQGVSAQQAGSATWRCGNSYSDRPCDGGRTVKVDDARGSADRKAADDATQRNAKLADRLERTRLSEEKEAHRRDRDAAQADQRASLAQRRQEAQERQDRARAARLAAEPRKATSSYGERPGAKAAAGDKAAEPANPSGRRGS